MNNKVVEQLKGYTDKRHKRYGAEKTEQEPNSEKPNTMFAVQKMIENGIELIDGLLNNHKIIGYEIGSYQMMLKGMKAEKITTDVDRVKLICERVKRLKEAEEPILPKNRKGE